jgi:hypothetical protein
MNSIYEQLAAKLDGFPHGFPRTESGVELRILEKIFAPDEAAMAVRLLPIPEPVEAIAHRLGRSAEQVRPLLDGMVRRGQILSFRLRGETVYGLAPFVIGIYEFQLPRMDAELATLVEEYAPHLVGTVGGANPALARVIPVNARLDATAVILPYEDVRGMLTGARSFRLMECICRTGQAKLGKPCSHPLETCMAFSTRENAYEGTLATDYGRPVTREEALAVLDLSERDGLVHCTYNVQREPMFVCNCCTCCCGFLRGVKEFGAPHLLVRSNWVSAIEAGRCTAGAPWTPLPSRTAAIPCPRGAASAAAFAPSAAQPTLSCSSPAPAGSGRPLQATSPPGHSPAPPSATERCALHSSSAGSRSQPPGRASRRDKESERSGTRGRTPRTDKPKHFTAKRAKIAKRGRICGSGLGPWIQAVRLVQIG